MRRRSIKHAKNLIIAAICATVFYCAQARAQSTDVSRPTHVTTGVISGRIAPRDVGDARLTRHFYSLNGTEGDLFIHVESSELNGDIDLFTANSLRPLLKITLYPGASAMKVSRSVYLRVDEPLILRVEGRAVADAEAQYEIRLEGAFRPASGALAEASVLPGESSVNAASDNRKGRRTTATGARIEEPPKARVETAEEPPKATDADTEMPAVEKSDASSPKRNEAANTNSRRAGNRNRNARRGNRRDESSSSSNSTPANESESVRKTTADEKNREESAPKTPTSREEARRTPTRTKNPRGDVRAAKRNAKEKGEAANASAETIKPSEASSPEPEAQTRLVIVTKNGEKIERDMRTVRRVTIERGLIVIVGTDGKITRQPLATVARMSIEP